MNRGWFLHWQVAANNIKRISFETHICARLKQNHENLQNVENGDKIMWECMMQDRIPTCWIFWWSNRSDMIRSKSSCYLSHCKSYFCLYLPALQPRCLMLVVVFVWIRWSVRSSSLFKLQVPSNHKMNVIMLWNHVREAQCTILDVWKLTIMCAHLCSTVFQ